jgi:hypothetical protein
MEFFILWLAPQYGMVREGLPGELVRLRDGLGLSATHRRTPANLAQLILGLRYFLRFAVESGAMTEAEQETTDARALGAILGIGAEQAVAHRETEPAARFLSLLRACIVSGSAHVASPAGNEPARPEAWGWRERTVGAGENERTDWHPQGIQVGWLDGNDLYLDPESSFNAAQRFASANGQPLAIAQRALSKRLDEKGLLLDADRDRGRLTVRRTLQGRRQDVWFFSPLGFFADAQTSHSSHSSQGGTQGVGNEPFTENGAWDVPNSQDGERPSGTSHSASGDGVCGTNGTNGTFPEGTSAGAEKKKSLSAGRAVGGQAAPPDEGEI